LFNFDGHPPPDKLTQGIRARPMGPPAYVRESISALLCDVDWSDPSRVTFNEDEYTMWFVLPAGPAVDRVEVEVVGAGNPVPVLSHLCRVNGWFAYDVGEHVFLDPEEPRASGWEAKLRAPKD
jgi:hypothetical protein